MIVSGQPKLGRPWATQNSEPALVNPRRVGEWRRDWVFDVAVEAWTPLDVKADDEAEETAAVDAVTVIEPGVDHVGCVGDKGLDLVRVECLLRRGCGCLPSL